MKLAFSLAIGAVLLAGAGSGWPRGSGAIRAEGVAASGTFATKDAPGADGFYEITEISGEVNGVAITGPAPARNRDPGQ